MIDSYSQLIQKLFEVNLHGGVKLGLSNCIHLDKALGYPSKAFKSIHIAGTNGKGSVTKKIAAALEFAGYRVGLYISPHISCFRERISINGKMISESDVESLLSMLFTLAENEKITPTFFEFTTLLALHYFAKENVDFAVLEVGLGGRLDATNIIIPCLSVITSISLEHTEILGNSIEEIALEKGGIIKPGIPVVLGPRVPQSLLQSVADSLNSPCIKVSGVYISYVEENRAIAKKALESLSVPASAIAAGLEVRLPCRLEVFTEKHFTNRPFPQYVILDVAHNADGLIHLFQAVQEKFPSAQYRILFGLSKTKDIPACLKIIKKNAMNFHLVEAPNGRGVAVTDLSDALIKMEVPKEAIHTNTSIEESVDQALKAACEQKQILIICGTFFIMGEVRMALGIAEPHDCLDLNEKWNGR